MADGRVAAVAEGAAPDLSVGRVVDESTAVVVEAGVLGRTPGPAAPADGVAGAIGWSAVSGALTGAPLVALSTRPGTVPANTRRPPDVSFGSTADRVASTWRGGGGATGAPKDAVAEAGVVAVAGGAETPQKNTATVVAAAPTGRSHE